MTEASMRAPIGIFDSGLGGLTVLREIQRLLPHENLIYVGDTARVPYGVKSSDTVGRYAREICDFLLSQQVKAIVVACNTVSAVALSQLKENYPVPMLGVLEPGAQAAVRHTLSGQIGVIGTEATVRSGSYARAIQHLLPQAEVVSRACPLFVPLVEEGWLDHEVTQRVAEIYLQSWRESQVDTLILGCTHYPLLKDTLQKVLGPSVSLVDSGLETAHALEKLLQTKQILSSQSSQGQIQYFSTDAPEKMQVLASRFLGGDLVGEVKMIQL